MKGDKERGSGLTNGLYPMLRTASYTPTWSSCTSCLCSVPAVTELLVAGLKADADRVSLLLSAGWVVSFERRSPTNPK